MKLTLLLLLTVPLFAGYSLWRTSAASLVAANALDIDSSRGLSERNALLSANGQFSPGRAIPIKAAVVVGVLLAEWLLMRKHPEAGRRLAKINFAVSGVTLGVATHNYLLH